MAVQGTHVKRTEYMLNNLKQTLHKNYIERSCFQTKERILHATKKWGNNPKNISTEDSLDYKVKITDVAGRVHTIENINYNDDRYYEDTIYAGTNGYYMSGRNDGDRLISHLLNIQSADEMAQKTHSHPYPVRLEPLHPYKHKNVHLSMADTQKLKILQRQERFRYLETTSPEKLYMNKYEREKGNRHGGLSTNINHGLPLRVVTFEKSSNMLPPLLRPIKQSHLKPTLFQQKEAAMLNLSLDSKMWQIKNTLEQMGRSPVGRHGAHKITFVPKGASNTRQQLVSKQTRKSLPKGRSNDNLDVINEFSDDESAGVLTYRGGGGGQVSDSDSSIGFSNPISKKNRQRRRKGKNLRKWRRLSHFLKIFFSLWKVHAAKVKYFLETNVDLIEIEEPIDLLFDVTEYKADKQACVSQETKRILSKFPEDRTADEVQYVQVALRNYQSIEEYPIKMTKRLAETAWYEKFDSKRIIIQQWHPSRCFYFILSGSVVVSKMDTEYDVSRTVCFLNRGESFGELGLINNAPRQATVISKEPIELLVINDEDYVEIFMGGGIKGAGDNFLKNLWCLDNWPVEILPDHPTESFLSYFKRNTVLVHDSNISEWLYIIKSGSCTVIKKLLEVQPSIPHEIKTIDVEPVPDPQLHEDIIEERFIAINNKINKRSKRFRQKELDELKMGIEMLPIENNLSSESVISISSDAQPLEIETENDNETLPSEEETNQNKDDDECAELTAIDYNNDNTSDTNSSLAEQNEQSAIEQGDSNTNDENDPANSSLIKSVSIVDSKKKTKLSSSGPFLKKSKSSDQVHEKTSNIRRLSKQEVDSVNESDAKSRQRKKSVYAMPSSISGSKSRRKSSIGTSMVSKSNKPKLAKTITEESCSSENQDDNLIIDDENTQRIRREFEEIIRGDTKKAKRKISKQEKKTISDELNIEYFKSQIGRKNQPEDIHPTFVRVQTLTKGSVFGLADIVHFAQPSLSLVSNGAECIVLRKKLFVDNCSQKLMNEIRQQVSPFPKNKDIQQNLQTFVDWLDRKDKTMKQTMMWSRKQKIDVHNSRSLPSFQDLM